MPNPLIAARDAFAVRHPEQRIRVNGRDWGVLDIGGAGPSLVLLPGTLGRGDIFWNQITALQDRAHILALSYPSAGTLQDWAGDICALMDRAGLKGATVLGSSLGGYVAQYLAGTCPGYVARLVAGNTLHSAALVAQFPPYNADLAALPDAALAQGFRQSMAQWSAEEPARAGLAEFLVNEATNRIPADELRQRLIVLKEAPELPAVPLPRTAVFTVESQDDRLIPPPIREAVRARLNPAQATIFRTGSHFPYITRAREYSALLAGISGLGEQEGTP